MDPDPVPVTKVSWPSFPVSQQECEEWPMQWLSVSHPALICPFLVIPRSTLISSLCHPLPPLFFSSGTFFFLNAFFSSVCSVLSIATNYSNLWVIAVRRAYSTVFYQAGHSKLSKELVLNIRFPNQPHHHPLPSPGPTQHINLLLKTLLFG